jgi:Ser/Thr protein kinase RdoA (MazF antagonist)
MTQDDLHPYDRLTPDVVIAAVESLGWRADGRFLALNSYENRVYQVGLEDAAPLVAKFYRPGRWSEAALREEHEFARELVEGEVPVIAPLAKDGETLFQIEGFRFAVYPRRGGRWPEFSTRQEREWMGRFLGRIHLVGRRRSFVHRPRLSVRALGFDSREFILAGDWLPNHVVEAYESTTADLLERIDTLFESAGPVRYLRLHGDCHPGNVLWTDDGPHFVDLDDCMTGPALQDLWMLLSGSRDEMAQQLGMFLEGYSQFSDLDLNELWLLESLRTLRMIHYAAWLARRWEDPAFPRAFPWFAEPRYWENHVLALREQQAALDEGPLALT